jgi:hypothetical protein
VLFMDVLVLFSMSSNLAYNTGNGPRRDCPSSGLEASVRPGIASRPKPYKSPCISVSKREHLPPHILTGRFCATRCAVPRAAAYIPCNSISTPSNLRCCFLISLPQPLLRRRI